NRLFDDFKARYPSRFLNCGVAEANMVGMAAGLAMGGFRPYVYTITPFVTTRVLEQIRVDVCYHELPVTIVGVGAGLSYASLRALPGMNVICPADANEVEAAVAAVLGLDRPAYLRLGKKGEPLVHSGVPQLEVGRALRLRPGADVCLLGTGNILPVVLQASDL